jgi:hypothetical protein
VLVYGDALGVPELTTGVVLGPAASDSCGVGYAYVEDLAVSVFTCFVVLVRVFFVILVFVACSVVSGTLL